MVTGEDIVNWFSDALGEQPIWTVEDLARQVADGRATIWKNDRSALFLRIDDYPNGERVVEVGPAGGDMAEIVDSVPRIEAWARERGCTQAHVWSGRKGWERVLEPQGYGVISTVIRKKL